ncbi:hypothetical protein RCL1_004765 [Eukaryota sp. TZLM3-RCL]
MPTETATIVNVKREIMEHLEQTPIEFSPIHELLRLLDSYELTLQILTETSIGKLVKSVFTLTPDTEPHVKSLCKSLLTKWIALAKPATSTSQPATPTNDTKTIPKSKPTPSPAPSVTLPVKETPPATSISFTSDATRDKVRELFFDLLVSKLDFSEVDAVSLVDDIEGSMFKIHGNGPEYRQKYRNLKAAFSNNPGLLQSVLDESLTAQQLITLSPADLQTETQKQYAKKVAETYKQMATLDSAAAASTTDTFKCGKCGQRKCTYTQRQTRSADEPMQRLLSVRFVVIGGSFHDLIRLLAFSFFLVYRMS